MVEEEEVRKYRIYFPDFLFQLADQQVLTAEKYCATG
jgi:hypothetical protein